MTFLDVWIGYAIVGTSAFSAMFIWAIRTGQFTDFDRARKIALGAAKPIETDEQINRKASKADRFGLYALFIITLLVLASAVIAGFRCR